MGWLRETFGRRGGSSTAPPAPVAPPPPVTPPNWRKLGNEALAAGNLAEAFRCYEQGALADPQDAALRLNLGFVLLEQGQLDAAVERLQQALALRRADDDCALHDVHYLLGKAWAEQGRHEQAVASFEQAVRAQPDFAEALEGGARSLQVLERHADAVDWLGRLLALRPTNFHRLVLASELRSCERHAEALELLVPLCAEEPDNVDASVLLFGAMMRLGRFEDALAEAERLLALQGPSARFLVNRSVPLGRLGRHEEALACIEQALAIEPANRDALVNRGTTLAYLGRIREAAAAGEEALQQMPEDPDLHWYLGMNLLLLGDLRRGWAECEWRARGTGLRKLKLDQPRWHGEDLEGRTIFLYGEQGFGDNIQFARYAQVVARMAGKVVLMVSEVLEPLVARTLPANCQLLPQGSTLPAIDYQCPLMSVPAVLGTTVETIPAAVPYLRADPGLVSAWRERLGAGSLHVGIAWAGNPNHVNDHNRSMALATFRAIDTAGCRFVTVQPELRETDRATFEAWPAAVDFGRQLRSFDDTAALVESLDLVITVDTSVAHLAGALGKPVWILLPWVPDWRWMLERTDSPWYPSARLYRQAAPGDWASLLARVKADLAVLARRH